MNITNSRSYELRKYREHK